MRLLAFSDLHGRFMPEARELIDELAPDWIVLLGDILPDHGTMVGRAARLEAQRAFWQSHSTTFERENVITTFIRGNHEVEGFHVPPKQQRLPPEWEGRVLRLEGIPIPEGGFGFAREMEEELLTEELRTQLEQVPNPELVLSHAPPFGCLDWTANGTSIGNPVLKEWMTSPPGDRIRLVMCGHVHKAIGMAYVGETLVVNLATGFALLEEAFGTWELKRLESLSALRARRRALEDL